MNEIKLLVAAAGIGLFLVFSYWSAKTLDVLQKLPATSHQNILEELSDIAPVFGLFLTLFGTGFIVSSLASSLEPLLIPVSILLGIFGVTAMTYTLYTRTMGEYKTWTQRSGGQN